MRDYLLRIRPIRTKYSIVLAEEATQLYRDTAYHDLISFEEDIAKIAAIVLVIAESEGSLAELGAFSSNETIRPRLRVIIPSHHEVAESFVRYGPIERIKKDNRKNLGIYPWEKHSRGGLNVSSVRPHYREIVSFINGHLDSIPQSAQYEKLESRTAYIAYWIIHTSLAITPSILYECVQAIIPDVKIDDIRNALYCMQLAKWIKRLPYSGADYFYSLHDRDPFRYAYEEGVHKTSTDLRLVEVQKELRTIQSIPRHIMREAVSARIPIS